MTVIEKLATVESLEPAQRQAVAEVRREDEQLREQVVSLQFRAMRKKMELRKIQEELVHLDAGVEREQLRKIARLWGRWLTRWNSRQRAAVAARRKNMQRLIDIFVIRQSDYERLLEESGATDTDVDPRAHAPYGALPGGKAYAPVGAFTGSRKDRVVVVRPHRPGSKWAPLAPPGDEHIDPSSRHFRRAMDEVA